MKKLREGSLMNQFKVIFFNVGGTLIQLKDTTLPALYAKNLSEIIGKRLFHETIYEAFQKAEEWTISRKSHSLFSDLDQRKYQNVFYGHLGITNRRTINKIEAQLAQQIEMEFILEKGAINLLKSLSEYDLGIISNWDESLIDILQELEIYDFFESITISGDVAISKPNIEIFKIALADFPKVKARETVYIGDDYHLDIIPAKQLKMMPILFDKGPSGLHGRPFYSNVDCIRIHTLKDIPTILHKISSKIS